MVLDAMAYLCPPADETFQYPIALFKGLVQHKGTLGKVSQFPKITGSLSKGFHSGHVPFEFPFGRFVQLGRLHVRKDYWGVIPSIFVNNVASIAVVQKVQVALLGFFSCIIGCKDTVADIGVRYHYGIDNGPNLLGKVPLGRSYQNVQPMFKHMPIPTPVQVDAVNFQLLGYFVDDELV